MIESKLIQQLKGLNSKELKGLKSFLQSPYFNNSKDITKLFEVIRKHAPNYDSPYLEKERVFKKVFPGKSFQDVKLRNLMSKVSRLVEKYLIQAFYEEHNFEKEKLLTKIYGNRNCYSLFEQLSNKLLKEINARSVLHLSHFQDIHAISLSLYEHLQTNPKNQVHLIKNAYEAFEQYYISERLRIAIGFKSRETQYQESHPVPIDSFEYLLSKTNLAHTLYKKALVLLDHPEEFNYLELKEFVLKHEDSLSNQEVLLVLRLSLNYNIIRMNDKEIFLSLIHI